MKKSKLRNFMLALLTAIMLTLLSVAAFAAPAEPTDLWTAYAADSFAGGTGTAEDPYLIADARQLALLSKLVNDNTDTTTAAEYLNKDYRLTRHIDLRGHYWVPIGFLSYDEDLKFKGRFDGDGYVISNMTIKSSVLEPIYRNDQCLGLFGCVLNRSRADTPQSWIRNVGMDQVNILCDPTHDGKVFSAGGLVGHQDGSFETSNCWVTGSITVAGTGNVTAIGGLVGRQHCGDRCENHIRNSYFSGTITGSGKDKTDALVGGKSGGSSFEYYRVTENLYYNSTTAHVTSRYGTGKTEEEMKAPEFAQLLGGVWQQNADQNNGLPFQKYPSPLWTEYAADGFAGGTGTEADPYQIATPEQLAFFAKDISSLNDYDGKYVKLTGDIDLSGHYWEPIGSSGGDVFRGTLDGDGHTIRNMQLSSVLLPERQRLYVGLFALVAPETRVTDLTLEDSLVVLNAAGTSGAGTLTGNSVGRGHFSYCTVKNTTLGIEAAVTMVGGFGGTVNDPAHCWAEGVTIEAGAGTTNLGGFSGVGSFSYPNCSVTGLHITATVKQTYVGGLTGIFNNIPAAGGQYVRGTIQVPEADIVAGISAKPWDNWYSTGYPRYSYAAVTIGETTGKRYAVADGAYELCFYDSDLFSEGGNVGKVDPKTTEELKSYHTAILLNRAPALRWTQVPGINDGYPVVETGTEEPVCVPPQVSGKLGRPLSTVALPNPAGNTAGRFEWVSGGALIVSDTPSYKAYFIPNDYKTYKAVEVDIPITTEKLWTDGITADANAGFAGGTGTVDDPYQIATEEQLALLTENVNTGANQYDGKHFLLTADLDLSAHYWEPIGGNSPNAFKGSFDGGFHTIRGLKLLDAATPDAKCLGLFGNLRPSGEASIRNLLLTEVSIQADGNTARWVGSLLGYSSKVSVLRCGAEGTIDVQLRSCDHTNLGGLAGYLDRTAQSCFFRGSIAATTGKPSHGVHSGLVGSSMADIPVRNCYAAASIQTNAAAVDPVVYNGYCLTGYYDKTSYTGKVEARTGEPAGVTTAELQDGDMWRLLNGPGGGTDHQGNADEGLNRSCRDWGQRADINGGYPVPRGFLHEKFDLWTAHAADTFAGGDGTQERPYEISTPEQLAKLAEDVNSGTVADGYQGKFFLLTADLDLTGRLWEPIGLGRKNFRGGFDGGLHTISGMTVRDIALPKHRHLGLFGCVNAEPSFAGDGIRNILLTGADIQVDLPGNHWVGSLAGSSYDRVERCGAQGTITAAPYVANLGGLVGWSDLGGDSCFFRGTITADAGSYHGGLIGRNHRSILENSYAAVDFTSQAVHRHPVTDDLIKNDYYDSTLCPVTAENGLEAKGAVGKTTAEMKTYAFAIALNGGKNGTWTTTGGDRPLLSGGQQAVAEPPQGIAVMENTPLEEVSLPNPEGNTPGVWVWVEPEKSVGNEAGEKTFAAVFFPTDTDFAPVWKNITVKVKKPPVLTITDNAATPALEVEVQYAEAGWCIAAVYTADGQMAACGQAAVLEGNSALSIVLGEYEPQEGLVIRAFLLDGQFTPQAVAVSMP